MEKTSTPTVRSNENLVAVTKALVWLVLVSIAIQLAAAASLVNFLPSMQTREAAEFVTRTINQLLGSCVISLLMLSGAQMCSLSVQRKKNFVKKYADTASLAILGLILLNAWFLVELAFLYVPGFFEKYIQLVFSN